MFSPCFGSTSFESEVGLFEGAWGSLGLGTGGESVGTEPKVLLKESNEISNPRNTCFRIESTHKV